MVICDLAVANHHVMRKHAADRLVEAATDRLFRNLEVGPGLGSSRMQLASAFSMKCNAQHAAYAWKYVRARSRSMALLHFGIFHSNSTSGSDVVFGKYIFTLVPVALTYPKSTRPPVPSPKVARSDRRRCRVRGDRWFACHTSAVT